MKSRKEDLRLRMAPRFARLAARRVARITWSFDELEDVDIPETAMGPGQTAGKIVV